LAVSFASDDASCPCAEKAPTVVNMHIRKRIVLMGILFVSER